MVNGMRVPLDMTDSKRKRKYIEKICLYNCFTHCIDLYGKERKANVLEMICLYNCFTHCI